MERLTKRNKADTAYYYPLCFEKCNGFGASEKCNKCELNVQACEKLGQYEDLEEQGLLLRLPCKVGDVVYRLIPTTYRHIESLMIREFVLADKGFCFRTEKTNINYSCADFGKTVFLTKEEAEQALAEMKGGSDAKTINENRT